MSALDVSVRARILDLLAELQATLRTVLSVHLARLTVVRAITDRVLVMQAGVIVEGGAHGHRLRRARPSLYAGNCFLRRAGRLAHPDGVTRMTPLVRSFLTLHRRRVAAPAPTGETLPVIDPSTGQGDRPDRPRGAGPISTPPSPPPEAALAPGDWGAMPAYERGRILPGWGIWCSSIPSNWPRWRRPMSASR